MFYSLTNGTAMPTGGPTTTTTTAMGTTAQLTASTETMSPTSP
jgi:hypothetical protein